jgi:large subunit ribosomal protein L13
VIATQKTYMAKAGEVGDRWYLVDARGQTLGRLAVNVARVLRGKHRPQYTPHLVTGDHVIVINAADIVVTGGKLRTKQYDRYSGYPGGRRTRSYAQAVTRDATFPLRHAVRGMLQHNTLGAEMLRRLRIYPGSEHRHEAQQPTPISFGPLGEIIVASNS